MRQHRYWEENGACLLSKNGRSLSQNVNGLGKRAFGLLPVRAANQYVLWQVITTRTMTLTDGKPQVFSGHPHLTKSQVRFNMPESFILAAQHAKTVYPRGITDITYDPYTHTNLKTSPQILAVDRMKNAPRRKPRHNRQKKGQHSYNVGNLARKKAYGFSGRPCGITRKDKIRHDEHSPPKNKSRSPHGRRLVAFITTRIFPYFLESYSPNALSTFDMKQEKNAM